MRNISSKLQVKNIFIFGAPGVGKGTYGGILAKALN